MSRELKFRGWNGESMEYGGFSIHASEGKVQPVEGLTRITVDSPIMQCIGLKDKSGKSIYENDIVKKEEDFRFYVVVASINGGFYPHHEDVYSSVQVIPSSAIDFLPIKMPDRICVQWEIVGNALEHPHLLKESEDGE